MILIETRPPPACERCGRALPGPDPLTRRTPGKHRRYSAENNQTRSPVRVSRPSPDGEPSETYYWCSSRCFYLTFKKTPEKKRPGKPSAESQFHINRAA